MDNVLLLNFITIKINYNKHYRREQIKYRKASISNILSVLSGEQLCSGEDHESSSIRSF